MQDPFPITPLQRPLNADVALPGSKSITNRALILAALASGSTTLNGALFSRDTRIMLEALETLGYAVTRDEAAQTITVEGSGKIPYERAELHVGNAGTAARFLTALLAARAGGTYRLDGDPAMRERPMSGLTDALTALGAAEFDFHEKPGHFPFTLRGRGYRGGEVPVDASASSQILSALLLAAGTSVEPVTLQCPEVRPAYVQITLMMREAFGAPALSPDAAGRYPIEPVPYRSPGKYPVEPDLSAASYFLALALIQGGDLQLSNLSAEPMQGDALFAEVLAYHGLRIDPNEGNWQITRPDPAIQGEHREIDFNAFSDTFLTYAAIAPLLGGSVRITGIGHTRQQETDRIAGMAAELSKLGQLVKEEDDALTIMPKPNELRARALAARSRGELLTIETYEDHRFAMSFGILGSYDLLEDGKPWLAIRDPACCGKTFPDFFKVLGELQG
jgi:3-phosphoshikimate 1-carboxyvinyltransferase